MQVFEYVIFYAPTDTTRKGAILKKSELFVAGDVKEATIRAHRDIPEDFLTSEKLKDVKVTIRPF